MAETANHAERAAAADAPATARATAKFTVLLSLEDAAAFDELAVKLRRLVGRRVAKGEIVRTLVALVADDATLRDELAAELRGKLT
jgi:hypothetical protein